MGKYIKSSYKNYFLIMLLSILIGNQFYNDCSICLNPLKKDYLVDAWGNKFHAKHESEGHYCHICSRLISEALTHGGFKTVTTQYICSLCYPDLIYEEKGVEISRLRVLNQLEKVGFTELFYNIPVILLNEFELLEISQTAYHKNLKGFTVIDNSDDYKIYILNNLHVIEFDAVLAHEYLHVWQNNYNIHLSEADSEGLSNLASALIYENYNNTFSKILNDNMINNDDEIYGNGYKRMNTLKNQIGWQRLIKKIISNHSY